MQGDDKRRIDTSRAPLSDGQGRIVHVALVYDTQSILEHTMPGGATPAPGLHIRSDPGFAPATHSIGNHRPGGPLRKYVDLFRWGHHIKYSQDSGLPAHNYRDNDLQCVRPLAETLRQAATIPAPRIKKAKR